MPKIDWSVVLLIGLGAYLALASWDFTKWLWRRLTTRRR
jgi:hypothetical protein